MNALVIYGDIACPWSSLAVHRLHEARSRLGLVDAVRFDHRAWPLELVNGRATPKRILDAEVAVIGSHVPELGWRIWQRPDSEYAVTSLVALEAVQAAKADDIGGLAGSEQLDRALRQALYAESRCVSLHGVVVEVAAGCDLVDADALTDALECGHARQHVFAQWRASEPAGVAGSPHVFVATGDGATQLDGDGMHNPGIEFHWSGGAPGRGFPVITADDPQVYDHLLRRAAG